MHTITEARAHSRENLEPVWGTDEAAAITDYFFEEKFGIRRTDFIIRPETVFRYRADLESILQRLKRKEPIQQILGYVNFCGMKIALSPDVLIPRPETEELVQLALDEIKNTEQIIADICTGSGCIALAIRNRHRNNPIIATDISPAAIYLASNNDKVHFKRSIRFEEHNIVSGEWPFPVPDIIVCNPPYINRSEAATMEEQVLKYEPHIALFVDNDDTLLFYKGVINLFLNQKFPLILFEINPLYAQELQSFCTDNNLSCRIINDMQGKSRFARIEKKEILQ